MSDAQNQRKIDSLKLLIDSEKELEGLVPLYGSIAEEFSYSIMDSAFYYVDVSLDLAIQTGDKAGEAEAYYMRSYFYELIGKITKAIADAEKATQLYTELKDSVYLTGCYNNLGVLYAYGTNQKKSLEYFIKTVNLSQQVNDSFALAEAYANIAAYFELLKDYSCALKYYYKALEIDKQTALSDNIAMSYIDIGYVNMKLHRYDDALENLNQAKQLSSDLKNHYRESELYQRFAAYYLELEQLDSAKVYIERAEKICAGTKYQYLNANLLNLQGKFYLEQKEYLKGMDYLNASFAQFSEIEANELLVELCVDKAKALAQMGKHNEAYQMLQKSFEIEGSLKLNEIAKLLGEFEQSESLKHEQKYLEEKNRNDIFRMRVKLYRALFLAAALALVLVAAIYFYMFTKKYSKKLEENYKKLEISEKKLKESNATKNKFFSIIAHDLKNPFNVLIGISDLMRQEKDIRTDEEFEYLTEGMFQAATSGYNLLSNLLEWAKTQTGDLKHNPKQFDLNKIFKLNTHLFQEFAKDKRVHFVLPEQNKIRVYADYNMTNFVIRNLFNNAIKFSFKQNKIIVSAHIQNGFYIVSVKDFGIGIKSDTQKKLFKIEHTVQKVGTNGETGTGLGLILCKEFIEKNGGKFWVESKENVGSKFCFTIPAAEELKKNSSQHTHQLAPAMSHH